MVDEPGPANDGIPPEFQIKRRELSDPASVSIAPDDERIAGDENRLHLQVAVNEALIDYRAAIFARADQIERGEFQDSNDFESEKETIRGGFLWRRKTEKHTAGKWINGRESDVVKYSRQEVRYGAGSDNTKYEVLLVKNNEKQSEDVRQAHDSPKLTVVESTQGTQIALNWSQHNLDTVQRLFDEHSELAKMLGFTEQLGEKEQAVGYHISLQASKSDPFIVSLVLTQEDQITEAEQRIQKEYDRVSSWDTDSGDGPSISAMRRKDEALEKIERDLDPLKEKRFHIVTYAFNAKDNSFSGTPENTAFQPEQTTPTAMVKITRGLLSVIPTDTRDSAVSEAPKVLTLALPGE